MPRGMTEAELRKQARRLFMDEIRLLFKAAFALEALIDAARHRREDRFAMAAAITRGAKALEDVRPLLEDKDGAAWG